MALTEVLIKTRLSDATAAKNSKFSQIFFLAKHWKYLKFALVQPNPQSTDWKKPTVQIRFYKHRYIADAAHSRPYRFQDFSSLLGRLARCTLIQHDRANVIPRGRRDREPLGIEDICKQLALKRRFTWTFWLEKFRIWYQKHLTRISKKAFRRSLQVRW